MAAPRSFTPRQEAAVARARKRGATLRSIAERWGVCIETVRNSLDPKVRRRHNARNAAWSRAQRRRTRRRK